MFLFTSPYDWRFPAPLPAADTRRPAPKLPKEEEDLKQIREMFKDNISCKKQVAAFTKALDAGDKKELPKAWSKMSDCMSLTTHRLEYLLGHHVEEIHEHHPTNRNANGPISNAKGHNKIHPH